MEKVKKAIEHPLVLIILFVVIFYGGYFLHFLFPVDKVSKDSLDIEKLNSFYSSLFTAITVVVALVALSSWKNYRDLIVKQGESIVKIQQILKDFEKIEERVKTLYEKKEHANWVREQFDNEETRSSYKLNLSKEERQRVRKIKEFLIEDHEASAWLEIIVAHDLISNMEYLDKRTIDYADKIYKTIENRNLFRENSEVEPFLCHLQGQLYKTKYDYIKIGGTKKIKLTVLDQSVNYYKQSLNLRQKDYEKLQTFSNLAVVLIEKAKLDTDNKHDILQEARELLNKAEKLNKTDFNIQWDMSRVIYYLEEWNEGTKNKIERLLYECVNKITKRKEKEFLIEKLREEYAEPHGGFPGDEKIITDIERKLNIKLPYI